MLALGTPRLLPERVTDAEVVRVVVVVRAVVVREPAAVAREVEAICRVLPCLAAA